MPHIYVNGCNMDLQIQYVNIHADVSFKKEVYNTPRAHLKLKELQDKIENLLAEYFDGANISSDIVSNHEHNVRMRNY